MHHVKVITIATDLENTLLNRLLIPSCRTAGLELVILHAAMESFEFADKRTILADYLSHLTNPDELLLFTDAYDTLFLRGPEYIEEMYGRFSQRVVFSANSNCWPMGVIGFGLFEGVPAGRYPYLCSGGFIGLAADLRDLSLKYPAPPSHEFDLFSRLRAHGYDPDKYFGFSDQYHWTLVQLLEPELIGLDNDGVMFDYYGPRLPEAVMWDMVREQDEAFAQGPYSTAYKIAYERERTRLEARLQQPSEAAQIHFASGLTKAVVLDLLHEGQLPTWITTACESSPETDGAVTVHRI